MSPRKKAQAAFASALLLLFLSGLATYFAIARLMESERWVIHTYEVKEIIGQIDSAILRAGRGRTGYVVLGSSGGEDFLGQFEAASSEIPQLLRRLQELIRDNREQRELCSRLETVTAQRIALLRDSIQLHQQASASDAAGQAELTRQAIPISSSISSIMQQMRDAEQRLLEAREKTSRRLFIVTVVMLAVAFVVALELFAVHYGLLSTELGARERAEQSVRESEESLRRLTGRLLQLQDAERRKFSRELHDSLGQYLAGAKMNLEIFANQHNENSVTEAVQLLDHAMAETRTISHLLHPPLLDEAGLSSAARWYVEGFAQRSGIEVEVDLPDSVNTLPMPVALALFRILQESLTNIHRHSGSGKAEVKLELLRDSVCLKVRDFGKGIAAEVLAGFETKGATPGVGLAGMRERVRDLGGQLAIRPSAPGTLISATIPLSQNMKKPVVSAAD